jgi:hypothetical protein
MELGWVSAAGLTARVIGVVELKRKRPSQGV